MLIFIRAFLILYGLIAIATGVNALIETYQIGVEPMADNSHRFLAAIWATTALGFFYCAWNPTGVTLFRFLMIALFIGGMVRAFALVNYEPTPVIIAVIVLELVPTPILWYMHSKLISGTA